MKKSIFKRDFSMVLIGQIISLFGAAMLKFCLSLYILDLTGSAAIFGTILAISSIPVLIFSPIGGAIADRFNKRNLMVIFDFSSSFVILIFLLLLLGGFGNVFILGIIMTLLSIISTIYQPTVQASIPALVEKESLMAANGMVQSVFAITGLLGPVVGGLLYGILDINSIVILSMIAFIISAVMEIFIHIPFVKQEVKENMFKTIMNDMKDGFRYILKKDPFLVKIMLIAAALNLFITPLFLVGLPYIIKIVFGLSGTLYGITEGAVSIGMLVGAILIGLLSKKLTQKNVYYCILISGILLIPFGIAAAQMLPISIFSNYLIITVVAFLIMVFIAIMNIFALTLVQEKTPSHYLGKVMAILIAVSNCALPLGHAVFGTLFEVMKHHLWLLILIVIIITFIITAFTKKTFSK